MRAQVSIFTVLVVAIFCGLVARPSQAAEDAEELAVNAAQAWLSLIDEAEFAKSWDAMASLMKKAVTKQQWESSMHAFRVPLGKVLSRKVKSKQSATSLPGAPDGQYVVIQYETAFENKKEAVETVTPMLDKDGKWRVSGYYIR